MTTSYASAMAAMPRIPDEYHRFSSVQDFYNVHNSSDLPAASLIFNMKRKTYDNSVEDNVAEHLVRMQSFSSSKYRKSKIPSPQTSPINYSCKSTVKTPQKSPNKTHSVQPENPTVSNRLTEFTNVVFSHPHFSRDYSSRDSDSYSQIAECFGGQTSDYSSQSSSQSPYQSQLSSGSPDQSQSFNESFPSITSSDSPFQSPNSYQSQYYEEESPLDSSPLHYSTSPLPPSISPPPQMLRPCASSTPQPLLTQNTRILSAHRLFGTGTPQQSGISPPRPSTSFNYQPPSGCSRQSSGARISSSQENRNPQHQSHPQGSSGGCAKKGKRNGNLLKKAKDMMMKWLYTHAEHPFPSEEEKKFMAAEGGITMTQVNNWFINARRRYLKKDDKASKKSSSKSLSRTGGRIGSSSPDNSSSSAGTSSPPAGTLSSAGTSSQLIGAASKITTSQVRSTLRNDSSQVAASRIGSTSRNVFKMLNSVNDVARSKRHSSTIVVRPNGDERRPFCDAVAPGRERELVSDSRPTKEAVFSVVSQPLHTPMLRLADQMSQMDRRAMDITPPVSPEPHSTVNVQVIVSKPVAPKA